MELPCFIYHLVKLLLLNKIDLLLSQLLISIAIYSLIILKFQNQLRVMIPNDFFISNLICKI